MLNKIRGLRGSSDIEEKCNFLFIFQISETWKDLWLNKLEIQVKASDNKRNNISID
jgi:hypothetical protein